MMESLLLLTLLIVGIVVLAIAVLAMRQRQSVATLVLAVVALGAVLAAGLTSVLINTAGSPAAENEQVDYTGTPLQ